MNLEGGVGGWSVGDFYIKRRILNSKYHILQHVVLNKIHMLKTMYKLCLKDVTIDFFLHLFIFRLKHSETGGHFLNLVAVTRSFV